jgi:hypothetical protein
MIITAIATALALQLGQELSQASPDTGAQAPISQVQYRVPVHPPPCGNGWDLSARDGMCYPNGYLPPQEQAARRYQYRYGGGNGYYGRYPVPCGNGADVDIRDGQCYPNGTVPPQFQQGRQGYNYGYRGRRGYYYDED